MMRILIVEDDKPLAQALSHILRRAGYGVDEAYDGPASLELVSQTTYSAIIMDIMLPKMDGFEVVRELRRRQIATPVLLLTARNAATDKIEGLDSGADDYMTKPFEPAELLAHVRALTRRQSELSFEKRVFADLTLATDSFDLQCGEKSIHLSCKESQLLNILMASAPKTLSKEMLIDRVWGAESSAADNNVEAYISFLRKKLAFLGSRAKIETLRKAGYRLVDSEE